MIPRPLMSFFVRHPVLNEAVRIVECLLNIVILVVIVAKYQTALKRSRTDYQILVDLGREPMLIHNQGTITSVNRYAMELFDAVRESDLIGRQILDFAHPDFLAFASSRVRAAQTPTQAAEGQIVTLTGQIKDVEVVGIPVRIAGAMQLMMRDISQRKQMEQELRRVADLFKLIEANITDIIVFLDMHDRVKYASPSHAALRWKIEVDENSMPLDAFIHPDDCERIHELHDRMVKTREPIRSDFRVMNASGEWREFEVLGALVIDPTDGSDQGKIFVSRDVTERKLTEELLRRSDKLSAIGQLAAGLAHEVRNPLTVLQGFIQLMRSGERKQEHLNLMYSELQRIESIISDFLVFSKPTLVPTIDVDVCQLLNSTVQLLTTQAILKSVELENQSDVSSVYIRCNADHLRQVFINLIRNAIEAMPNGGTIIVRVERRVSEVAIAVIDQGSGIPPEVMERLGEPFLTTKADGTGLGLLITHRLVAQNHGHIQFFSQAGVGTQVVITFPLTSSPPESASI